MKDKVKIMVKYQFVFVPMGTFDGVWTHTVVGLD